MCITEEDNTAQMRMLNLGKSYQYGQVTLSIYMAENTQYRLVSFSAQLKMCSIRLIQV